MTSAWKRPAAPPTPDDVTARGDAARTESNDLDGYRGLAAIGIVVFHAYQFSRGDATASYAYASSPAGHVLRNLDGLVSMFLVLSAYLLYLPLARSVVGGTQPTNLRVFVLRRAARILPLYWVSILLVWSARNPALPGDWRDLVEHLTFTQVFDSKRIFYTIGPAWSLSVEVFFYAFLALLIPAFAFASARIGRRSGRIAVVLVPPIALATGSAAFQVWALLSDQPATRWSIWFNPLARADMFAAGMAVAVLQVLRPRVWGTAAVLSLRVGALALLAYGCVFRTDEATRTVLFNLVSTIAFALLIGSSAFDARTSRWRRALAARWLLWLGVASYSLYIWHEPVLLYLDGQFHLDHAPGFFPVNAVLLIAASVPVAWLSVIVIERPLGRLRLLLDRDGRRRDYYPELSTPKDFEQAQPLAVGSPQ
jgi:peptidoglycan/LPS O-acetylase OafA/YrhL